MAKERPKRQGVMLAYPCDAGKISRLGDNFLVQPKINGERCVVHWFAGEPVFISSYGNEFKFLDRLKYSVLQASKIYGEVPFDGEIYVHGWAREEIDSALRRRVNRSEDTDQLEYHVFDVRTPEKCYQRLNFLFHMFNRSDGQALPADTMLRQVPVSMADTNSWMQSAIECVKAGYEGIIMRKIDAPWQAKRTVNMLKFKPTETDSYLIVSVNEAIDKHGHPKGMVGSFVVKPLDNDQTFAVSAGKLKHQERIHLWQKRNLLPGMFLIVKHEMLSTSGGVPLCSVAVSVVSGDPQ